MVYFDEFFLFLSIKNLPNDAYVQYLYVTKQNMELTPERTFQIHTETYFIDKVVNFDVKYLFTVGSDNCFDENHTIVDKAYVIKIWDFQSLIAMSSGCKLFLSFSYFLVLFDK